MIERRYPARYFALYALSLGLISGCASDSSAMEKRLARLHDDLRKLQNDSDRVSERLEAVELRQARADAAQNAPKASAKSSETVSRPRLKVLHLTPDGEGAREGAAAEPASREESPRMILKGQGKELELKQGAGDSSSKAAQRPRPVAMSQNEGTPQANGGE